VACSMHGGNRNTYLALVRNWKARNHYLIQTCWENNIKIGLRKVECKKNALNSSGVRNSGICFDSTVMQPTLAAILAV
jgi:hypothetical protein